VNSRSGKSGFTLIEILVAAAIIVTIVSMVYGSYFATSKSARSCKSRIALSRQGRKVLEQIARQIRCSYVGSAKEYKSPARPVFRQREKMPEDVISYFDGNSGETGGEILQLVTTSGVRSNPCKSGYSPSTRTSNGASGISEGRATLDGLFETTYKFDKSSGTLFFSQERFVGAPKSLVENKNWQPIAGNVESVELAFFDGQQWLHTWDFKEKKSLPNAVRINITCEDENCRQYHYGTIAYVCCRKNQAKKAIQRR